MTALTPQYVKTYRIVHEKVYERAEEVLQGYGKISGDGRAWSVEFARLEGDSIVYEGTERYNGYGDERPVSVEIPVRALTDDSYLTGLREKVEAEQKAEERRTKREAADRTRARKKKEEAELARLKEIYE